MNPQSSPPDHESNAQIEEALGDEPRAAELRRMSATLRQRQALVANDLKSETEPDVRARLQRELNKLDEQIAVLNEEAQITQFVEDSVRVGLEMHNMQEG